MAGVNFSGFNGFDFGSIINVIIESESRPLNDILVQEQKIKAKDSALSSLAGHIGKLQTQMNLLTSATIFTNVEATSSDTGIATTTVGSDAITGRYSVNITQLAKAQVTASANGFDNTTDVVADGGSISFTINGSTTEPIVVTAGTTLAELKDRINSQGSDVVASIVNNGTNHKLVISSRNTGASNGFSINNSLSNSGGSAVAFAGNSQNAQDAQFTVNGIDITSASNNVSSAVPGVTISLVKEGTVTIDVAADHDALKESLKTVVTEFNKLREFAATQSRGPLAGDSVLRQTLSDIRNVILGSNSNGSRYQYLAEIGLEFTQTGELKLDEAKYNEAVNKYPTDLQKFFQGTDGTGGVFNSLRTRLEALDGTAGLIKNTRNSIDTTLKSYRDRIAGQQMRLELRRQELTRMYAAADQAMSRLNSMSSQLQGLGTRIF